MASIGVAGAAKSLQAACVRKLCVLSRLNTENVRNCHSAAFLRLRSTSSHLPRQPGARNGRKLPLDPTSVCTFRSLHVSGKLHFCSCTLDLSSALPQHLGEGWALTPQTISKIQLMTWLRKVLRSWEGPNCGKVEGGGLWPSILAVQFRPSTLFKVLQSLNLNP